MKAWWIWPYFMRKTRIARRRLSLTRPRIRRLTSRKEATRITRITRITRAITIITRHVRQGNVTFVVLRDI